MCWHCWYACLAQGCILPQFYRIFPPIWLCKSQICGNSCWCFRNLAITTWDVETSVNNGINNQPQQVSWISEPSTVPRFKPPAPLRVFLLRSCTKRFRSSSTEECRIAPNGKGGRTSSSGLPCASRETYGCGFVPHMAVAQTCKRWQELTVISIGILMASR